MSRGGVNSHKLSTSYCQELLAFSELPGQAGEFVPSEKDNEVDSKRCQELSGMEGSRHSMNPHELDRRSQPDEVDTTREDRVIQLGIDALHLFKDSRRDDFDSGDYFEELNNEYCDDWDSENARSFQQCCASGDIFNQRSIPFIIGSRNFLESTSGES